MACSKSEAAPLAAGPACGLGHPSRGATRRISVSPKLSIARAALPIFSPSCGRTSTMTGCSACAGIAPTRFLDRAGEFLEVARFGKIAINAGEADVGHRIQLAPALHHHRADLGGGHLAFAHGLDLALDAGNQLVDALLLDAALAAGEGDRLLDLAAVEGF